MTSTWPQKHSLRNMKSEVSMKLRVFEEVYMDIGIHEHGNQTWSTNLVATETKARFSLKLTGAKLVSYSWLNRNVLLTICSATGDKNTHLTSVRVTSKASEEKTTIRQKFNESITLEYSCFPQVRQCTRHPPPSWKALIYPMPDGRFAE